MRPVDFPSQPWFLVGPNYACLSRDAFADVGSDGFCVFLNVGALVVGGCLFKHVPVCGDKAVLKC